MLDVSDRSAVNEPEPPPLPLDEPEPPPGGMEPISLVADDEHELALASRKDSLIAQANALQVVDAKSYEQAAEFALTFAGMVKDAEAYFDPDIAKAHALHKSLCEKKNDILAPLKACLDAMKTRARAWWNSEEQKRLAEQRRLEEVDRQNREAEKQRLETQASAAETAGDSTAATDLRQEVQAVDDAPPPPPAPSAAPKVRGFTPSKANWTFVVEDKRAFVKAVADGTISLEAVEPNAVYLRARAKADKNTLKWPGVKFYDKGSTSVRS